MYLRNQLSVLEIATEIGRILGMFRVYAGVQSVRTINRTLLEFTRTSTSKRSGVVEGVMR